MRKRKKYKAKGMFKGSRQKVGMTLNSNWLFWLFGSSTTTTNAIPNTHAITDKIDETIKYHIKREDKNGKYNTV